MAWTVPDKGEGDSNIQSILFQEYLEVLVAGISGQDCVLSGGVVTPNTLLTLNGAKAAVLSAGILKAVAASTTITIGAADATNPRIDLVVINSSGAWAVRAGTAAAAPKPPARTANDVVMAAVYVPALDATIGAGQIVDMRVIRSHSTIDKVTTPVTINTDSTARTYYSLVIPSGLFVAGRMIRVTMGGNFLMNSGAPKITLIISYGGTVMVEDQMAAAYGADADRRSWVLSFILVAQANNDQSIYGQINQQTTGTYLTATTGLMEYGDTGALINSFAGSAAVDSDAADRTLLVQMTMSVSNAADEIVMEGAIAELQ